MSLFDILDLLGGFAVHSDIGLSLATDRPLKVQYIAPDTCRVNSNDSIATNLYSTPAIGENGTLEFAAALVGSGSFKITNFQGVTLAIDWRPNGLFFDGANLSGGTRYLSGIWVFRLVHAKDTLDVYLAPLNGDLASYISTGEANADFSHVYRLSGGSAPTMGDRVSVYVKGTTTLPSYADIYSFRYSSSSIYVDAKPVAIIKAREETVTGSVHIFDGSTSYDPDGSPGGLSYSWEITNKPEGSRVYLAGDRKANVVYDGITFKSVAPGLYGDGITVDINDPAGESPLILDAFETDVVITLAHDGAGITTTKEDLVSAILSSYHIAYNSAVSDVIAAEGGDSSLVAATVSPLVLTGGEDSVAPITSFVPDIAGLYTVKLIVSNTTTPSDPFNQDVEVHSVEGVTGEDPDMSFLWKFLPDGFYGRVAGKDIITNFWSTFMQTAGAQLLRAWQEDRARNLSTIQPTYQKRWLGYRTKFKATGANIRLRTGAGTGWLTTDGTAAGTPVGKLESTTFFAETQTDLVPGDLILDERDGSLHRVVDYQHPYVSVEQPISCGVLQYWGSEGSSVYGYSTQFEMHDGDASSVADDFLWLSTGSYRINSQTVNVITLASEIPHTFRAPWEIVKPNTTFTWRRVASIESEDAVDSGDRAIFYNGVNQYLVEVLGTTGAHIGLETTGDYALQSEDNTFLTIIRRVRIPIPEGIIFIPTLRAMEVRPLINDKTQDTVIYSYGADYIIEDDHIVFNAALSLPEYIFAEVTYFDNSSTVEDNFGLLVGLTVEDMEVLGVETSYLQSVKGTWYAFISGPIIGRMEDGAAILFGIPFAEKAGVIISVDEDFAGGRGRILIESDDGVIRSYLYRGTVAINPDTGLPYAVGDTVDQYARLGEGAEILDWVNSPGYFSYLIKSGIIKEPQKLFTFVLQIDADIIGNPENFDPAVELITQLKPAHTNMVFAVVKNVYDEIDVDDEVMFRASLRVEDNVHTSMFDIGVPNGYSYNFDHHDGDGKPALRFDQNPSDFPEIGDPWSGTSIGRFDRLWECGPYSVFEAWKVFFMLPWPGSPTYPDYQDAHALTAGGKVRFDAGFKFDEIDEETGLPDYFRGFHWYFDIGPITTYDQAEDGTWIPVLADDPANAVRGLYRVFPRVDDNRVQPWLYLTNPQVFDSDTVSLPTAAAVFVPPPTEGTATRWQLEVVNAPAGGVDILLDGSILQSVPAGEDFRTPLIRRDQNLYLQHGSGGVTVDIYRIFSYPRYQNEPWPWLNLFASTVYQSGPIVYFTLWGRLFNVRNTPAEVFVGSYPGTTYLWREQEFIVGSMVSPPPGIYDLSVAQPNGRRWVWRNAITVY